MKTYRESEFGKDENIYIHVTRPYAWIWRAKTPTGRRSKYFATVQSSDPMAFTDPRLPKLPDGYSWYGPYRY